MRVSQREMSAISSGTTPCAIAYSCHSMLIPFSASRRAALREAREHDAPGGDAARVLVLDQLPDDFFRGPNVLGVLNHAALGQRHVVPGAHHMAAVDGDRAVRGVRKHETQRER